MWSRATLISSLASVLLGIAAGRTFVSVGNSASALHVPSVGLQSNGDQRFWNWDYYPRKVGNRCAQGPPVVKGKMYGVENPVSFIFTGDATVQKLAHVFWNFPQLGSDSCLAIVDRNGHSVPLRSKGLKSDECWFPPNQSYTVDLHIRLYGPQNAKDPLYRTLKSGRWGHFVLGEVHADINDCQQFFPNADTHYPAGSSVTPAITDYLQQQHCTVIPHAVNLHSAWAGGKGNDKVTTDGWVAEVPINKVVPVQGHWECAPG